MHAFGFDAGRAAVMVRLGSGASAGEEFFLQLGDERFVFAVGGDDDAEFLGEFERLPQFGVIDAEGSFVGEEDFEAADALFDDFAQLFGRFRVETRHAHVEGVIAAGFAFGFGEPRGKSFGGRHVARGTDHFENRGGPADQGRFGSRLVVVLRARAHEGQVDVRVRVDETGEDMLPLGVDHLRAGGRSYVLIDPRDGFTLAEDVCGVTRVRIDDIRIFDEQCHGCYLSDQILPSP